MRYVYFTKSLDKLSIPQVIEFLKNTGLDGADLAVRPRYPVNLENVTTELPKAAKAFKDAGLIIGLVTAPTNLNDPESPVSRKLFEACGESGVPAIKIGYFFYAGKFDSELAEARKRLKGFVKLAARTGVRACYHTHSGSFLGSNAAGLRLLLQDVDPHHVGAFLDTGHLAVGGSPFPMEVDMVRRWFSLLSIKDMLWERKRDRWEHQVVPVGEGIIHWPEIARGLKNVAFDGTISLHAEYEAPDLAARRDLARKELAFLKKQFA